MDRGHTAKSISRMGARGLRTTIGDRVHSTYSIDWRLEQDGSTSASACAPPSPMALPHTLRMPRNHNAKRHLK